MTFTEAALLVLRLTGKPLHYKEITDVAIERSLLSHVGKSPEVTMGARLAAQVKNVDKANPLKRVKPGVFALSEWDEKTVEAGLEDRTPALTLIKKAEELHGTLLQDLGAPSVTETNQESEEGEAEPKIATEPLSSGPDEDEQHRAELSAGATELFASEDDDDQPIFGAPESSNDKLEVDDGSDGKRRRRRRRGRGRRDDEAPLDDDGDDLPKYTVSDAAPDEVLTPDELGIVFEDISQTTSLNFSDALYEAMVKQNSSRAGISAQSLADSLRRKFKGELSLNGPALIAVAATDNLARKRRGAAPRFRLAGSQLALTDWLFDRKFADKNEELLRASEQIQKATLRLLAEELRRLPQRAVGELVLILLESMGVSGMTQVRRPGAHGSELHLSGLLTRNGAVHVPVAIVIRRDARDIGREKVTELRGALHHYGSASMGWLITTGQVLSGAKEEAQGLGASPITLTGRSELAELFLAHGIGVKSHSIEIPVVDVALFESLTGR